jgi:SAM-dependent methyltransferase
VLGRLFGLRPAGAAHCRVLELGCGDGANALAIAQTLPDAHVVGVDAAAAAIERGQRLARAAGLQNVELRVGDLADAAGLAELRPADYIIAHGVYSWISPELRGALLECTRRCLAPHGIAFISYNAYPGSYLRDMARDILEFHLRGVSQPADRLARSRELMETIASVDSPSPYARVLREHLQRMLAISDALLYHDDLAAVSTPFYFHEFIGHAAAHGLQFLSEAELSDSQMRDVPERVGELIAALPDDVIQREQYLDFFRNRMFRQTLVVHESVELQRAIDDQHLDELLIASTATFEEGSFVTPFGVALTTSDPLLTAALHELCDTWPGALRFAELCIRTARRLLIDQLSPSDQDRLRAFLLDVYLARLVELHGCPLPAAPSAGSHPSASPLARAQTKAGSPVLSTLTGGNVMLEQEVERNLLARLDGTRDTRALAAELGLDRAAVDQALSRLLRNGLIWKPPAQWPTTGSTPA